MNRPGRNTAYKNNPTPEQTDDDSYLKVLDQLNAEIAMEEEFRKYNEAVEKANRAAELRPQREQTTGVPKNWGTAGSDSEIDGAMYRRKETHRRVADSGRKIIDKPTYHRITNPAIKRGADIRIADSEWARHLNEQNASAVTIGKTIIFREDATVTDVLEEVHHFYQNLNGLNDDKPAKVRTLLNEIDVKKYLLSVEKKYKIPIEEVESTRTQLASYTAELRDMVERGEWTDEDS